MISSSQSVNYCCTLLQTIGRDEEGLLWINISNHLSEKDKHLVQRTGDKETHNFHSRHLLRRLQNYESKVKIGALFPESLEGWETSLSFWGLNHPECDSSTLPEGHNLHSIGMGRWRPEVLLFESRVMSSESCIVHVADGGRRRKWILGNFISFSFLLLWVGNSIVKSNVSHFFCCIQKEIRREENGRSSVRLQEGVGSQLSERNLRGRKRERQGLWVGHLHHKKALLFILSVEKKNHKKECDAHQISWRIYSEDDSPTLTIVGQSFASLE